MAGSSDWLDGYIARNFNQQSVLGSILDPLADKALVAAVAVPLAIQGCLPIWLAGLMLARDVGLVAGVLILRSGLKPREALRAVKTSKSARDLKGPPIDPSAPFDTFEIRPTKLSKANTALQVVLLGSCLSTMIWQVSVSAPPWCEIACLVDLARRCAHSAHVHTWATGSLRAGWL